MPDSLKGRKFYFPKEEGDEPRIAKFMDDVERRINDKNEH